MTITVMVLQVEPEGNEIGVTYASSHLKLDGWNISFLLGRSIFRSKLLVSRREKARANGKSSPHPAGIREWNSVHGRCHSKNLGKKAAAGQMQGNTPSLALWFSLTGEVYIRIYIYIYKYYTHRQTYSILLYIDITVSPTKSAKDQSHHKASLLISQIGSWVNQWL